MIGNAYRIGRGALRAKVNWRRGASAAWLAASWLVAAGLGGDRPAVSAAEPELLRAENIVAWCIVPFDAKKRGPAERAEMLKRLGIRRAAYDWRQEHVASFEEEILAYREHGIEYFAFWSAHEEAFRLFEKHKLHPQVWYMIPPVNGATDQEKINAAVEALLPVVKRTAELKCPLGLYNHGGWGGEPRNLVAVCRRLRELGHAHAGIVYNFHHGHQHIDGWAAAFRLMKPYLLCLNLNGMNARPEPKILGLGQGAHELEMLKVVAASDYRGPIGILDHRPEWDAEQSLAENLRGLEWLRKELQRPGSGGPRPRPARQPVGPRGAASAAGEAPGEAAAGGVPAGGFQGVVEPGNPEYRRPPLTVECVVRLTQRKTYNILVASDPKASAEHWEIFSLRGSGRYTAYFPGHRPDHVRSNAMICDGMLHHLAMIYEPRRVRLLVDGKLVADQMLAPRGGETREGGLGIGRLVEGGLGCTGEIYWVRISRGVREAPSEPAGKVPPRDAATLGLWRFADGRNADRQGRARGPKASPGGERPAPSLSASPAPVASAGRGQTRPPRAADASLPGQPRYDAKLVAAWCEEATARGDPARGAGVFAAAKNACLTCHRLGKLGGEIGPELTRIGTQRTLPQLVESVVWPHREVKPEYTLWQVVTRDGQVFSGYRVGDATRKTDDSPSLVLKDPARGVTATIARGEIEFERAAGSPMPTNLTAALSPQQRADLFAFLSHLGRPTGLATAELEHLLKHAGHHGPATFAWTREPLRPALWAHDQHPVNRHRLYDFYSKQAEHFRGQSPVPMLLPAFPGLDGGEAGHWGYQNDQQWRDDRWNQTDLGTLQGGVFRDGTTTVPRGICVRLGENGELAACFNPDTLSYDAVWNGGFVRFAASRHGFLGGVQPVGERLPITTPPVEGDARYLGLYRSGKRVVFHYRIKDVEYLDSPWVREGTFVREVAPLATHPLRACLAGGASQWPQELTTEIAFGEAPPGAAYAIDTIGLPIDNPWKALVFCGGHDFLPGGDAIVATIQGDLWRVSGLAAAPRPGAAATWRRIAAGLHHPLGVVVADGQIYVQCRDQLMRLQDLNHDGEIDYYACFSTAFETSPAGHDFICGLERDAAGHFYTASGNQGLVRISPDGREASVVATGFRNPDGLGLLPDGTVTVPCSEGEWTPASMICAVPPQPADAAVPHYGYRGPHGARPPALPLVYLPRGLDNSSGGQTYVRSRKWGPLAGQLLHFSFGMGTHFLVLRDEVDGQLQGAVVPLPGDFRSGAHRGRFHPLDGQLYVSGMDGWVSFTPDDGCFQRVRYTGAPLQVPVGFRVHQNGVAVTFAEPVDARVAGVPGSHFAQCWNYRYSAAYGSPELSPSHAGVAGHDPWAITGAHVLPDRRTVFLEIPDLQPVSQLHLRLHVNGVAAQAADGHDLFVTVHRLAEPFTKFPGYRPVSKLLAAHPLLRDLAERVEPEPNPWLGELAGARKLTLRTGKNLAFATRELRVRRGEPLELTLANPDVVPHNWALVRPGALQAVGELANQLIADPQAVVRQYIPETDDVLVYTDVVPPGKEFAIRFRAPRQPGRYPYLCTFPGHWMVMNGVMVVE